MAWEDFWWDITESIDREGIRKEFDAQLEKMNSQDKHLFKDTRDRWEYEYNKVIKNKKNKKD